MHQTLHWSAHRAKTMLDANPTAAHHFTASPLQRIHWMITKHPQNGSLKGISTLMLAAGQQTKLMKVQPSCWIRFYKKKMLYIISLISRGCVGGCKSCVHPHHLALPCLYCISAFQIPLRAMSRISTVVCTDIAHPDCTWTAARRPRRPVAAPLSRGATKHDKGICSILRLLTVTIMVTVTYWFLLIWVISGIWQIFSWFEQ